MYSRIRIRKDFVTNLFFGDFFVNLNATCIGIFYFKQIYRHRNATNAKTNDFRDVFQFYSYSGILLIEHALNHLKTCYPLAARLTISFIGHVTKHAPWKNDGAVISVQRAQLYSLEG